MESRCLLAGVTGLEQAEGEPVNGVDMDIIRRVAETAWLAPGMTKEGFIDHFQNLASQGGQSQTDSGSGEDSFNRRGFQLLSEVEPNNSINTGNRIPLGFGPGKDSSIDVLGSLTVGDLDVFLVDLKAGDILGASVDTAADISIQKFDGTEIQGADFDNNSFLPTTSPLPRGGAASASYVITEDGTYAVQVGVGTNPYRLTMRTFRPVLESQPVGTKQILYLDFDGATIDSTPLGGPNGIVNLSPLSTFLPGVNLGPADEDRVIDAIVATVEENFQDLRDRGTNGDFQTTGRPGDFDIEIRNSRDDADPWGRPNVSRIIIGGTQAELGIPTVGIAESVDVGNFNTEETAVVLLDELLAPAGGVSVNQYPLAGGATIFDVIGEAVGGITVHEAGHYFGVWHQDPTNNVLSLMDSGGNLDIVVGVGPDGIFGTADDVDVDLAEDIYDPVEGLRGLEDALNIIAHGLSTGTEGALVTGFKWHDLNGNGIREAGEPGLEDWLIFADANGNLQHDPGEFSTLTEADGSYALLLPSGTHRIAEELQPGWEQTFPLDNSGTHTVTVTADSVLTNINFGNRSIGAGIRGQKFHDLNGDGVKQGNEPGLSGFYIYIDSDNDGRPDFGETAAITDAAGNYFLPVPFAGTFRVREAVPSGWTQTFPTQDNGSHLVQVDSSSVTTGIDFGNTGQLFDFGNAGSPYQTLLADDGPRHGLLPGFQLGPTVTGEGDAILGPASDNDGITFDSNLFAGGSGSYTADVRLGGHTRGILQGWIDFNQDGTFSASEQVARDIRLGEGQHPLTFSVPADAMSGSTVARFRYGWERGIGPTGPAMSGEVEDHTVTIFGDVPVANDDAFLGADGVDQDSAGNFLDVLANDFPSSNGPLRVQSVQNPTDRGGTTFVATAGSGVLYTPRPGFFGTDTFTYTVVDGAGLTDSASVTVTVRPTFSGPVAVDDSFFVSLNASNEPLLVLSNDLEGPNPPTGISTLVEGPFNGQAFIDDNGTADPTDDLIRYTPDNNFEGNDFITYQIADFQNQTSQAVATITVGDQASRATVAYSVRFTDANRDPLPTDSSGNPQVAVGESFFAEVHVEDTRPNPVFASGGSEDRRGVFAAYIDFLYQTGQVSVDGELIFDGSYTKAPVGDTSIPGIVDEAGAFRDTSLPPPGADPEPVFRVPFRADSVGDGLAEFFTNPADLTRMGQTSGQHDTLIYEPPSDVPVEDIFYDTTNVRIVSAGSAEGEFALHNQWNAYDVNNDGDVTPLDVVLLTGVLQSWGPTSISNLTSSSGEGEGGSRTAFSSGQSAYYNVIPDDVIDVRDAAALISVILSKSRAEGELAPSVIPGTDLPQPEYTEPLARTWVAPALDLDSPLASDATPQETQPQSQETHDSTAQAIDLALTQREGRWTSELWDATLFDPHEKSEDDFYADILDGWERSEEQE